MRRALRALAVVLAAALIGLAARQWLVGAARIAGASMADTLQNGDVALVTKLDYRLSEPARGDVVVCAFDGREDTYVKRVVGLPGDEIAFSEGRLTVNGQPVAEPYVSSPTEDFQITVGEGESFVLGDNRAESYDSRAEDMGCVGRDGLLGRVRWILWPLNRFGGVN